MERISKGKSIIAFPAEYACVDIETTGLSYDFDEIIEISAAVIKQGQVVSKMTSLVKPSRSHALLTFGDLKKMGYESYSDLDEETYDAFFRTHLLPPEIVILTGITDEMLADAPEAEDVLCKLYAFLGDRPVVGHNVHFDVCFLYDAFMRLGLTFSNDCIDTMRIARKLFPELPHHRLSDIVQHLNIEVQPEHRAESDMMATFGCFEKMKGIIVEQCGIDEFIHSFAKKPSHRHYGSGDILSGITCNSSEIDETNPLYQKSVVFTGALSRMGRKEALQIVADLGGIPADSITKKTNYLVIGNEEFVASVKDGKTSKMKKAEEYQSKGCDIMVMPEDTFFDMICPYFPAIDSSN